MPARMQGIIRLPIRVRTTVIVRAKGPRPARMAVQPWGQIWLDAFKQMMRRWSEALFRTGRRGRRIVWPPLKPATLSFRRGRGYEHADPLYETGRLFDRLQRAIEGARLERGGERNVRATRAGNIALDFEGSISFAFRSPTSTRPGSRYGRRRKRQGQGGRSRGFHYALIHQTGGMGRLPTGKPVSIPARPFVPRGIEDFTEEDINVFRNALKRSAQSFAREKALRLVQIFHRLQQSIGAPKVE